MNQDTEHMRKWLRQNLILFLLGCFLLIDVLSLGIVLQTSTDSLAVSSVEERVTGDESYQMPLKLSEIRGPMIDEEAAMVVLEDAREILPLEMWVFLLVAYVALLLFNLSFHFERTFQLQWGWEVLLTILALTAWYVWDKTGAHLWYPLAVLKTGLLIYAIYLYFFGRKILRRSLEEERVFADDDFPSRIS